MCTVQCFILELKFTKNAQYIPKGILMSEFATLYYKLHYPLNAICLISFLLFCTCIKYYTFGAEDNNWIYIFAVGICSLIYWIYNFRRNICWFSGPPNGFGYDANSCWYRILLTAIFKYLQYDCSLHIHFIHYP